MAHLLCPIERIIDYKTIFRGTIIVEVDLDTCDRTILLVSKV